ncbi:Medium-chain-fatty-acid--CoA ligase (fragment) [Mesorhizobium metallidurans STM 2683]|uniref:Medium-chain-fatty-acid--CoA ligase n=1 Tax=Mesorhizobium metallidurans STM 2683 TaxID=1297569 RepID=M5EQK7_9HYPH
MLSTMQDAQLGIGRMIRHMARVNRRSTLVCPSLAGGTVTTFGTIAGRAAQLADALGNRGVGIGDRVASFMSASQEHFEAYLGVPYLGAVLHTVNIRLHSNDIAHICNEADDRVFLVDDQMIMYFFEGTSIACDTETGRPCR